MNNRIMLHIGFGNIVMFNRVIAIISPESAPIKRIITEAREKSVLIDATHGRRTRAVIITDSNYIILSSLQPETLAGRISQGDAASIQALSDADGELDNNCSGLT